MKRTVFYISDQTAITSETIGHTLLSQFEKVEFEHITLPYIDSIDKAYQAVSQINKATINDNARPLIFDTIINAELRAIIAQSKGFILDIFSAFLGSLEKELALHSSHKVGRSHSIIDDASYKTRIQAVHFALENDDGAKVRDYNEADVILIGVSRTGKTPTCLYLALQFGVKAANYPLTEEDIQDLRLPKTLQPFRTKLFGLTIEAERLAAIRNERRARSKYAAFHQCQTEVQGAEAMFRKEQICYINTTHLSVEEISTRILAETGITRRSN